MRRTLVGVAVGWCCLVACSREEADLQPVPFSDNFDRAEPGPAWSGAAGWTIREGTMYSSGTKNAAIWLKARLPDDAIVEMDVRSEHPDGDIKFEAYGDGKNHASGYIFIFGGWHNSLSCIARLDEHGADRVELKQPGVVQPGKVYHFKLVRKDKTIQWFVDGKKHLDYFDSDPLRGRGHDRFAFNNWASYLYFDNLSIRPWEP